MGECVVENLLLIVDYIGAGIALIIILVVVYLMYLQYRGEQAEWEARRDHEAMQKSIKEGNKEDDSARNRRL
jgi:hypothetical protein